jgi:hypothetical protein
MIVAYAADLRGFLELQSSPMSSPFLLLWCAKLVDYPLLLPIVAETTPLQRAEIVSGRKA